MVTLFVTPAAILLTIPAARCPAQVTGTNVALSGTTNAVGPNLPGAQFTGFLSFSINNNGSVLLEAVISGTGITAFNNQGLWRTVGGVPQEVARTGSTAPQVPLNPTIRSITGRSYNDSGTVAYQAFFDGNSTGTGIFAGQPGNWTLVARTNQSAPGVPGGATYAVNGFGDLNLAQSGHIEFISKFEPIPAGFSGATGLWVGPLSSPVLRAYTGGSAPGVPGLTFGGLSIVTNEVMLASTGQMTFQATVGGAGITGLNSRVIFSGTAGTLSRALQTGDQVPGAPVGAAFDQFNSPVVAGNGHVGCRAVIRGTGVAPINDGGIWFGPPGALRLIARESEPAPNNRTFMSVGLPATNNSGQLVFQGKFNLLDDCIWMTESNVVRELIKKGDPAPGAGALTFINGLSSVGTNPGIDDAGRVAFSASMNGTGANSSNNFGIWRGRPGQLTLIARTGSSVVCGDGVARTASSLNFIPVAVPGKRQGQSDNGWLTYRATFTDGVQGIFVVPPPCAVDINGLDGLNVQDIFDFLNGWFLAAPLADFNGVDGVTIQDIFDFLNAWFAGC